MPKKVYLSLVFHNHQPVGNFDFVFQEAFDKSYEPITACLERHPNIRAGMHLSGCLRDWLMQHQPGYYDRLAQLVDRGQLEILSGAYYEPILVMLTDDDKIGQIEKLNDAIESDFGQRPRGMWLAERVWEPYLAKPIAQAGLEYAIVDDTHFEFVGFKPEELYGYYVTDEQSYPLKMLPSLKEMRYRLPWNEVDELISYLRSIQADPHMPYAPLVFAGDDGEKFGLWPGTYERCWEQGYMDRFFSKLENSADWLVTITPGDYVDEFPAIGRAYLPAASYVEMTEWSLPAESAAEMSRIRSRLGLEIDQIKATDAIRAEHLLSVNHYLRGGYWRNFLVKYPESNQMQKRGAYLSRRAHQLTDEDAKQQALNRIWAAQCNCAYWHGLFGGVYLFHIRATNYANLIEAAALIPNDAVQVERIDFDLDSYEEIVVNTPIMSLLIDLRNGGAIYEWDDFPTRYNLLNIMTRRFEGYHARLQDAIRNGTLITPDNPAWDNPGVISSNGVAVRAKSRHLEDRLIFDWHRRGLLVDHFIGLETTIEEFSHATYEEPGDFVNQLYEAEIEGDGTEEAVITLTRQGRVWYNSRQHRVTVQKRIEIESDDREVEAHYTITNDSDIKLPLRFAIEAAVGFDGGDSGLCYFKLQREDAPNLGHLGQIEAYDDVEEYRVGTRIRGFEVQVELDTPAELWRFPLEPVTMSEGGFESIHQGNVFLHIFRFDLEPGASWETEIEFEIEDL